MNGCTIELFSCAGGMAEGFRRAGIRFDFVFDWNANACASYEQNLRHRPVQLDVRDLLRLVRAGWSPGPVRLLVADPPCTPWSRAGKRRGLADDRDLLRETVELIRLLRPAEYMIGNVPGLQDATVWHVVQDVIGGLSRDGYCTADYKQLDAADYGVPQHRVRPFWYGHLGGPCLRWPAKTHTDPMDLITATIPGLGQLRPWVTCRDALAGLRSTDLGRPVRLRWREGTDHRTLTQNANGDGTLLVGRNWPWDRPATTVTTDPRLAPPGHHEGSFLTPPERRAQGKRVGRADKPSATTTTTPSRVGAGAAHVVTGLGVDAVVLSERAAAILQGFPDGWVFAGRTKRARWAQIGMAMPPALAHAVASAIAAREGT